MRALLGAGVVAVAMLAQVFFAPAALAGPSQPPPPPPAPGCKYCPGPPPPPTPVPTLAPAVSPPVVGVAIHLSAGHVRRGRMEKLTVTGPSGSGVSVLVQYRHGKPSTYHGKLDGAGTYVKTWKVPRSAPLGKSTVKVTVTGSDKPQQVSVSFTVVK